MLRSCLALLLAAAAAAPLAAAQPANPQIDYPGFRRLAAEVQPYRRPADRLGRVRPAARPARRAHPRRPLRIAFRAGHIAGAVNLPLTDFTAESLARVVGRNRNRPILIYCNNNFRNDRAPVMLKRAPLALNIQTFINLYGYGYRNVYELGRRDRLQRSRGEVGAGVE